MLNDIKTVYDIIQDKCWLSDDHTGKDTFDCAWIIDIHYKSKFTKFLQHLCDTHVIDLHTPDQLLELFQQNNFGE